MIFESSGAVILCAAKAGESLVLADQRGKGRKWSVSGYFVQLVGGRWRMEAKNNELDTFFHLKFCCLSLLVLKSRVKKGSHPDLILSAHSALLGSLTLLQ
eukprot:scaffold698_cov115-Skeletonema_dohrnii-CCMP3373.AAC.6